MSDREMTLEEYVSPLPETHTAMQEFRRLTAERDLLRKLAETAARERDHAIEDRDAAERDRDAARQTLREHVAAVEKVNKVYMDEIQSLMDDRDRWKASHDGQQRNTIAFMEERDAALAEVERLRVLCGQRATEHAIELQRLRAIEAAAKEWDEACGDVSEAFADILAGKGPTK